ncbi:M48 family metallopeptidase [Labilibaculum sp.]|uniref:M48 family metallopeptidase n=1 Tax=Labilibaculum sp. TaxID=2060723 RepID=UPI003562E5FC
MNKLFFQGLLSICIFFGLWCSLQQVNWLLLLNIEQTQISPEETVGDLYWEYLSSEEKEITNNFVLQSIDSILTTICESNHINSKNIQLHIIDNAEINAFALPNKHLLITSGLLLASENEIELAGVISHELAHIELNHVIKKLAKKLGLSVITAISSGNNKGQIIREGIKLLSSSAYDRNLEKEADLKAVKYLENTRLKSDAFASFLYRLSLLEQIDSKHLVWMSTHPNSKDRVKYILKNSNPYLKKESSILHKDTWAKLKLRLKI